MFVKLLIESLISFLALDSIWISQVASPWMKKAVPHLMSTSPNLIAALVFYLIYLSSLLYLIIIPGLSSTLTSLMWRSFLFGFTAYATYDLTNLAVMKNYPFTMAVADMFWGGILTMLTAFIIYKLNV